MDTTEEIAFPSDAPSPGILLGTEAKYYLHTAGRWATFLGILGLVFTGIIVIAAIFVSSIMARVPVYSTAAGSNVSGIMMHAFASFAWIIYLVLAVFYFFFSFYLYKFGSIIKTGTKFNDGAQVTNALKNLKSFFKLWGISTIVIISLYIVGIIAAIAFTASMAASFHQ